MKTTNKILSLLLICTLSIATLSCKTSNAVKGGAIGGAAGGVIGGLLSKNNTATGIIVGSAIGGSAGAIIGNEMDKQAEELKRDLKGAKVERVGEGIKITFDSGILFGVDEATLNVASQTNLTNLATTLKKYEDTNILIEGHTDDTGAAEYNQTLSEQRASTVADFLSDAGVDNKRLSSQAFGEEMPAVPNTSAEARAQNRRVEVAIYANKKMQKMAEKGELGG
ncbi:OmpA family protein [Algoriphagus jejuensis]|uniref:OmpA family protein n=1 Tax=Algoriphagus jejuensis TaxID=419934 RepID=A0ABN1N1M2_9BACT